MTITEILEQAQHLSPDELEHLITELVSLQNPRLTPKQPKTGKEIAAELAEVDPIDFILPDVEDPVEWVRQMREQQDARLKPYWTGEK